MFDIFIACKQCTTKSGYITPWFPVFWVSLRRKERRVAFLARSKSRCATSASGTSANGPICSL